MAIQTTNPGYVDSEAYRAAPTVLPTPDNFHNEYHQGMMSFILSQIATDLDAPEISYDPTNPGDWPDPDPSNVQEALDDLASTISHPVLSVFARTGVVVAAASDYDASQVDNDSAVIGTFVSDALNTLAGAIPAVPVDSVFARTGAVVAAASDYDASQVDNDSTVAGTFVSDALDTLLASGGNWPSIESTFDTGITDADPGSGKFRYDNATQSLATFIYVNNINNSGGDVGSLYLQLITSDRLYIEDVADSAKNSVWQVTGAAVNGGAYVKIPVTNTDIGTDLVLDDVAAFTFAIGHATGSGGLNGSGVTESGTDSNAGGAADTGGNVEAAADQSLAVGYATGASSTVGTGSGPGNQAFGSASAGGVIVATGEGSVARGRADGNNSAITCASDGSIVSGNVLNGGVIADDGGAHGSILAGYVDGAGSIEIKGRANLTLCESLTGGKVQHEGMGSLLVAAVVGNTTAKLVGNGGFIYGYGNEGDLEINADGCMVGGIAAAGRIIKVDADGAIALGYAATADITATAVGAIQFGQGDNGVARSFQCGDIFRAEFATQEIYMPNLPTVDPGGSDQLWNDAGTLKVT